MDGSREEMIVENMGLVPFVVRKLSQVEASGLDPEDAIAYGIEGLIQAVDRYDEARGTTFSTFAISRIRGSILDAARQADPLPRSTRKMVRLVDEARLALATQLGRWPERSELEAAVDLPAEKLNSVAGFDSVATISLNELLNGRDDAERARGWEPTDPDEYSEPGTVLEERATTALLHDAIRSLPDRERQIIAMRYRDGRSLSEIAGVMQLSESRICQIHKRILGDLKSHIEDDLAIAA